ncbi:LacI family DNA-binding transcriptional regulator [Nocardioides bruguierae]|uniref:LacI family DNA-binding transcriptional regulator n=1 Tax=Nocardioides bruguierae TaxID=2945102 RepID=UPI002020E605|nr:LacI family DNA-binding transcriptional regulator [Nocardioides bruguierae]MCL8025309.1 LacI family transcriptional regulator [Nocardioides bruguierae]
MGPLTRTKAPTVHDVAKAAGFSAQTVSRVIAGYEGIRPATRLKVEQAIAELGYRPNHAARQLRTSKSTRIGAVVHEMFAYGPSQLLRGAAQRAREAGYSLNIVGVDGADAGSVQDAFETFELERVAGILAITLTEEVRTVVERRPVDVPLLMDPAEAHTTGPSAGEIGSTLAAEHLVGLGHRRLAMVLGPSSWLPARQRQEGFERAVASAGASCVRAWQGDWSAASGYAAAQQWEPGDAVTGVFAANDAMAIGFVNGLARRGIAVPEDVSVIGFDATPEAEYLSPALTSVSVDYAGQGRAAVDALLAQVDADVVPGAPPSSPAVVLRGTTATR